MDPMTPGGTPDKMDGAKAVASMVGDAEKAGKLQKLQDYLGEYNLPEDAGALIILAQKDERTKGKTPDELADMMRADRSLYDDLVAYKPGGALEKLGKHPDVESPEEQATEPPGAEKAEDAVSDEDMSAELEGSSSMKGLDIGKAKDAAKKAGYNPKTDAMDYDKKKAFMDRLHSSSGGSGMASTPGASGASTAPPKPPTFDAEAYKKRVAGMSEDELLAEWEAARSALSKRPDAHLPENLRKATGSALAGSMNAGYDIPKKDASGRSTESAVMSYVPKGSALDVSNVYGRPSAQDSTTLLERPFSALVTELHNVDPQSEEYQRLQALYGPARIAYAKKNNLSLNTGLPKE